MVQKTFHFYDLTELNEVIKEVHENEDYKNASGVLVQLYNCRLDIDEALLIETLVAAFPDACITGVTAANIADKSFDISEFPVEASFSFFKDTKLVQFDFNMDETTTFVAGRQLNEKLETIDDLKCMQIFYNTKGTSVNYFVSEFSHLHIPKFGVKAGRSIRALNQAHVYGKKVYCNAFVVILFISKSLKLYMDNNLGWQPIGVEMAITKTKGDTVISEIDMKPAIDIFSKYLKVKANEFFVHNVCEFPLIIERDCLKMARVPAAYDDEGGVVFTSDVHKGDHFRLSYADKGQLFASTRESVEDVSSFEPEALYLFECGNRLRFLKQQYLFEINEYRMAAPQLSAVTGYAEVFITPEGIGGDLNSSLVVVGLKEDVEADDRIIPCRTYELTDDDVQINSNGEIPFVERILAFLESTSQELDEMNRELGKIAYTDQLTRVHNRWELDKKIIEALELNRQGMSYGIMFFDIDHFKHVNDTYGHDVGDDVLLAVVTLVREFLEDGHALGRWGGEEFIYLIPNVDEKALFKFAEKIRKAVDEVCFVTVQHITISIGCTLARVDDTPDTFVKRADDAVYEAKETGRNKVILH